ncbi:ATP-binding protein [Actinacidiphila acidipaludis]|uniref:histidine kinase n=1 Tax=Actinacidiphila acidipaludis TaxID=2873382 RepID=A0ABS7QCI7_9ACTN|nr:ATP-binding protein [Streptomyces acidipaludis]MBY8880869.1 ATP-binding protein [Streptomyces acidipaludis]
MSAFAYVLLGVLVVVVVVGGLIVRRRERGKDRTIGQHRQELLSLRQSHESLQGEYFRLQQDHKNLLAGRQADLQQAELDAEARAKEIMKAWSHTLQTLTVGSVTELEKIERKYGDHPVLFDLMRVSHAVRQTLRRLQTISVICGGSLGRRRSPATLYEVAQGAKSSLQGYDRINVMNSPTLGLKAAAVPAVSHAIAELLHNATDYSNPNTNVYVQFENVHNGMCVEIDDMGVGMDYEERNRAAQLLSGEMGVALADLGNPPRTGFAAMGILAAQHGFTVDVMGRSAYGGVRAVVRLPRELLTEELIAAQTPPTNPSPEPGQDDETQHLGRATAHGLPRRAPRQNEVGTEAVQPAPEPVQESRNDRQDVAASLRALQRGTRGGRVLSVRSSEGDDSR